MMRSLICFTVLLSGAAAKSQQQKQGECLVDSGEAVSDALDASMFIWASYKRCGKNGQQVNCEIDISSAVKSVNSMINVILKVANKCDALHIANKKCGMAAGQLTEHMAGLSAASGQIAARCPVLGGNTPVNVKSVNSPVLCTVNLKNTAKDLFDAIKAMKRNHKDCASDSASKKCTTNILDIVGSFAGMGQFLAGTVGECKKTAAKAGTTVNTEPELCAQASGAALEYALKVSKDGIELSKACKAEEGPAPAPVAAPAAVEKIIEVQVPRLYEQDGVMGVSSSTVNLFLGALLPVTAIASFVGGRFYSNRRAITEQSREFLSDNE